MDKKIRRSIVFDSEIYCEERNGMFCVADRLDDRYLGKKER